MHVEPLSCETTVTGLSSETPAGQLILNGGGGLQVAFGWHSTLMAAEQPSLVLKTVHARSFTGGVVEPGVVEPGGVCGCDGGPCGGGVCCDGGCCGGGGFAMIGPGGGWFWLVVGGCCGRGGFVMIGPGAGCVGPCDGCCDGGGCVGPCEGGCDGGGCVGPCDTGCCGGG